MRRKRRKSMGRIIREKERDMRSYYASAKANRKSQEVGFLNFLK